MTLPIKIVFIVKDNGQPLSDLVCFVQFLTEHKNDYSIGPYKTNMEGEFIISRKDIEDCVRSKQEDYPMDYDGGMDNFTGEVTLTVDSESALIARVDRIHKFYPEKADQLKLISKINSNSSLEDTVNRTFQISDLIELDVSV